MFSLAHGNYSAEFMLMSFLLGVLEGYLYLANHRNLWLPIAFHGVTNTISLTRAFLGI